MQNNNNYFQGSNKLRKDLRRWEEKLKSKKKKRIRTVWSLRTGGGGAIRREKKTKPQARVP